MSITDIVYEGLKEPIWKVSRGMTLLDMVKAMKPEKRIIWQGQNGGREFWLSRWPDGENWEWRGPRNIFEKGAAEEAAAALEKFLKGR